MPQHSYKAQWAQQLIRTHTSHELSQVRAIFGDLEPGLDPIDISRQLFLKDGSCCSTTPLAESSMADKGEASRPLKICIVGAGVSGLYIALLLDSLEDPDISYDILEASDQVGGRVRTHRFSAETHDYCDTGAMRFPNIPLMKRAFDLFGLAGVRLIPYFMEGPNCPSLFNDILKVGQDTQGVDAFGFGTHNGGLVPDRYATKGASQVLEHAFKPFKDALARNFDKNFQLLLDQDRFSTTEYLRDKAKLDYHTIQWLETMCSSTGLFNQSLTESILDSLDFDYPRKPVDWYCVDGGGSMLTDKLLDMIKGDVLKKKFVTAISIDRSDADDHNMCIQVRSEAKPRRYSSVFNTTSLACMQRMNLSSAELHPAQKEAVRSLHYDASVKVAMKFRYPWWITKCGITKAGVASTDSPLRLCVYPSYSLSDDLNSSAVLLCSYTWAQDALRVGALVTDASPDGEEELRDLMIRDLARLHAHGIGEQEIADAYVTHYAFDWTKDQYTSGAFALFAPGQFSNLYPYLSRPSADAKLHIVGEATSAHHAWLVGSLDSAYRAVHHFLERFDRHEGLRRLEEQWGIPDEMETGPSGTSRSQVMLGRLRPGELAMLSGLDEDDGFVFVSRTVPSKDGMH